MFSSPEASKNSKLVGPDQLLPTLRPPAPPLLPLLRHPAHRNHRIRRFLGAGLGVTFFTLILRGTGLLQGFELRAYDLLLRKRPTPPPAPLVVVGFDEEFLARPGAWPASDEVLAQLLKGIAAADPAAIGLDIYRDVPVGRGREELQALYRSLTNLYGIQRMEDRRSPQIRPPQLLARNNQVGFNNVVVDSDGRLRRSILYWWDGRRGYQSLALKLATHYLRQEGIGITVNHPDPDRVSLGRASLMPLERNSGAYQNEDASGYQIFADFRGGRGTIPVVPAQDIIDRNFDPRRLKNRIVVVGVVADSVKDSFHTPYTSNAFRKRRPVFGAELHAQLATQLIDLARGDRPVMRSWSEGAEMLWIVLWCVGGTVVGLLCQQPVRGTVVGIIGVAQLGVIGYVTLLWGWWLPIIPPMVGVALGN